MRERRGKKTRKRNKMRKGGERTTEDDLQLYYYQKGTPQQNREKSNGENEKWEPKRMKCPTSNPKPNTQLQAPVPL